MQTDPKCPCCGQPIQMPAGIAWDKITGTITTPFGSATLRGSTQRRCFDVLWRARGIAKGLTAARVMDLAYADDADGGPTYTTTITETMRRIRVIVADVGLEIKTGTGGGDGYRLAFTTPDQARSAIKISKAYRRGRAWESPSLQRQGRDLTPLMAHE